MLIAAFSRTPFMGTPPERSRESPGAQNQECLGAVPSGPTGGLRVQNLPRGSWFNGAVPLPRLSFLNQRSRYDLIGPAGVRPLREGETASAFAVGAAHWAARRLTARNLSPATPKGALLKCSANETAADGPQREAQHSGFALERRSKGAGAVFAVRRKRS